MQQPSFIDPSKYAHLPIPEETERAWAAGFFDGEGWCGVSEGKYLTLVVTQTEMSTLLRFKAAVGGHGRIYQRSKNQPTHWTLGWNLQIGALAEVTHAVNLLWEYLSGPKRGQIHAAFRKREAYRNTWPAEFALPHQKLTDSQVLEIKALASEGMLSQYEIAARFGVSNSLVSQIKRGVARARVT